MPSTEKSCASLEEAIAPRYQAIAQALLNAQALLITAGSGMSVDSGLPDFGGGAGFWKAYPQYQQRGIRFEDVADLQNFITNPERGWGFYGQRARLYRNLMPHQGYTLLLKWLNEFHIPGFVVTTNVDCQFLKAGFSPRQIYEMHGTVHHLQCISPCCTEVWENNFPPPVNEISMEATSIPHCSFCNNLARPNVIMYGDDSLVMTRIKKQRQAFYEFLEQIQEKRLLVMEIGAGTWVPTLRNLSTELMHLPHCTLLRINPQQADIAAPHFSCKGGALAVLGKIERALQQQRSLS